MVLRAPEKLSKFLENWSCQFTKVIKNNFLEQSEKFGEGFARLEDASFDENVCEALMGPIISALFSID